MAPEVFYEYEDFQRHPAEGLFQQLIETVKGCLTNPKKPEKTRKVSYGIQADMFSLGIILYMLMFGGVPPFQCKSNKE